MIDFDPNSVINNLSVDQINEMQTMIECFTADPHANPIQVQQLIAESIHTDLRGRIAYALLGLYAIGKIEWKAGDPWTGRPGGWIPRGEGETKKDFSIN